ncbi:MAG TPA: SRPBCC domain-containing protein [bacterium]|jgi:uncharacterized protein YndB with AHSA1/START domain
MTQRITWTYNIDAPPEKVYGALTDPAELTKWFCEQVDFSLDSGHFNFWGKYTPDAPGKDHCDNKVKSFVPGNEFTFVYDFSGDDVEYSFLLDKSNGGTKLTLQMTGFLGQKPDHYWAPDLWHYSMDLLMEYVEKGEVAHRPDYSVRPEPGLVIEKVIDAPVDKVWTALTDKSYLRKYLAKEAEFDLRVGGDISFGWDIGGPKKILEIDENRKFSYSWQFPEEPESKVVWELEPVDGKTRVRFTHEGIQEISKYDYHGYIAGWMSVVSMLRAVLENPPDWEPYSFTPVEVED